MELTIQIIDVCCPLCGESSKELVKDSLKDVEYRVPGDYEISKCLNCKFVYLSRRPGSKSLPRCYGDNYYVQPNRYSNRIIRFLYTIRSALRFRRLAQALEIVPKVLLEVGCGDANFLSFLESRWRDNCRFIGLDLFLYRVQLNPDSKVKLIQGEIETVLIEEVPETVVLWGVLEHLPQPIAALQKIARCMSPDGVLIGQLPNWNCLWRRIFPRHWSGLQIPRHQSFFDSISLKRVLEAGGFRLEKVRCVFDPGDLALSLCNWLTDTFKLKTLPRQAWFFFPLIVTCAPIVLFHTIFLRQSGEMEFVARKLKTSLLSHGEF